MIQILYGLCVLILTGLCSVFNTTYQGVSVAVNLWLQGGILVMTSLLPVIRLLRRKPCSFLKISVWSAYAILNIVGFIWVISHYHMPINYAFNLCVADLGHLALSFNVSYMTINILIFVVGFLTLFCINVFSYSTVNWRKALRPAAWLIGSIVTILLVIAMIQPFRMHTKFERGYIPVAMSETFKSRIAKDVTGMDVEQILDYSHDLTKSLLTYSWTRQPFNEHRVTSTDCFGYAQVFATISNYALKTNKFPAKVKAVCGQVHFLGINVHPIVESL